MKRQVKIILSVIGCLFLIVNMYLILKDDSKIERSAYVKNFSPVAKQNIKQTFNKKGIIAPLEDYHYYYDQKMGSFKQFLVNKGNKVEVGTPLYEYISDDIDADIARVEAEKAKVENQIDVLEDHISDLTNYKDSLTFNEEEKPVERSIINSIEQDIYDKELQANLLRQTADKLDQDLEAAHTNEGKLTVVSEFDGIVKDVNISLGNPLITISSVTPTIQGSFTEEERFKVDIGIPAVTSSKQVKGKLKGTLSNADSMPNDKKTEKNLSHYPFLVQLEEDAPELLQGSHVDVSFITKEIDGALMIPKQSVVKKKKKSFVWIITKSGKLEKREIKTGTTSGRKIQVKSGVDKGELIVIQPKSVQKGEGPTIITPMNLAKLEMAEIKQIRKKHILKYMVKGILIR